MFGRSGFLGVHVVRAACAAGLEVMVAGRTQAPAAGQVEGVPHKLCDALTPLAVERVLEQCAPDVIVLCTALATIAECERYPVLARTLNVELPARIAVWSRVHGARLVSISTDLVFGARPPRAERFSEEDEPAPTSEYGRTKASGEQAVLDHCEEALVVRLPLLTGESFGRGLGASDSVVASVRRGAKPLLFTDEWRTPLDAARAGSALVELALLRERGVLHLAGAERLSRCEIGVRALIEAGFAPVEARAAIRPTTRAAAGHSCRPADVSLDSTRARRILALDPPPTLT
ncbi:MAG: sugar nucleotide-binding protein [Planctomycetes bacterium]|nr:sugar nucleotide-binding protein [Planctomycetota bacterium]